MSDVITKCVIALILICAMIAATSTTYMTIIKNQGGVAIASLMRRPVDISLWLNHHRKMGVKHFYIRLEDSPGWVDMLESQKDVTLVVAASDVSGNNYETLQYRQHDFVNWAINQAMGKYSWLFHIDADELLHGNLSILSALPKQVKCVHMQNVEAVYDPSNNDTCFSAKKFLKCSNGAPCKSYGNGKAGGRVEEGVSPHGPHMFIYKDGSDPSSYYEIPFDDLHVLHFDACSFGTWVEKYFHLGRNKQENIPFTYYNESIKASKDAFDTYQKYKMQLDGVDESFVYTRDHFVNAPLNTKNDGNNTMSLLSEDDGNHQDETDECSYGGLGCAWVKQ